ncbi:hypothetical protein Dimus_039481 [Dionaea muscipula]
MLSALLLCYLKIRAFLSSQRSYTIAVDAPLLLEAVVVLPHTTFIIQLCMHLLPGHPHSSLPAQSQSIKNPSHQFLRIRAFKEEMVSCLLFQITKHTCISLQVASSPQTIKGSQPKENAMLRRNIYLPKEFPPY